MYKDLWNIDKMCNKALRWPDLLSRQPSHLELRWAQQSTWSFEDPVRKTERGKNCIVPELLVHFTTCKKKKSPSPTMDIDSLDIGWTIKVERAPTVWLYHDTRTFYDMQQKHVWRGGLTQSCIVGGQGQIDIYHLTRELVHFTTCNKALDPRGPPSHLRPRIREAARQFHCTRMVVQLTYSPLAACSQ